MTRGSKPEVRNPVLALPAAQQMANLPPEAKAAFCDLLQQLQTDCRQRANHAWAKHKAPMAAYWKQNAVWAGHIRKALKSIPQTAGKTT
jgi:hypothetical protein